MIAKLFAWPKPVPFKTKVLVKLDTLNAKVNLLMTTVNELVAALPGIQTEIVKVQTEITAKIAELEAIITNGGNTPLAPDAQAAFDSINSSLQALDAIVPDVTPTP